MKTITPIPANISDGELSALVAIECAGWRVRDGDWVNGSPPPYSILADAVLPLLEKFALWEHASSRQSQASGACRHRIFILTETNQLVQGHADTFARAACFTLLLSTGKFTITTPAGTKAP